MSAENNETLTPWWATNRDKFILWAAAAMFGLLLWSIPAQLSALKDEHKSMLTVLQIQCVHDAKDDRQRDECLTLRLGER